MENQINSSKITEQLSIVAPVKWEAPQLFKTDFDTTESGQYDAEFEGGSYNPLS